MHLIMHRIMPHTMHIMSLIMPTMPHIMPTMPHLLIMPHIMPHTMPHLLIMHRIMLHPLRPIVGMVYVIMGKHVIHVYGIVLLHIVIIVTIRIIRLPHGWNVHPIVVIINPGFHHSAHLVVAQNKIMRHLQQDIFPYIGPNVRVRYSPFVEMEYVIMGNYVMTVRLIVEYVLHLLEQVLQHIR